MFSINFINSDLKSNVALGEIKIGDFVERFRASTNYWTQDEYRKQWIEGVRRLLENDTATSTLCTDYNPPESSDLIDLWYFYRQGKTVSIFNAPVEANVFKDYSAENFKFLYEDIPHFKQNNDASKWEVEVSDLQTWLNGQTVH